MHKTTSHTHNHVSILTMIRGTRVHKNIDGRSTKTIGGPIDTGLHPLVQERLDKNQMVGIIQDRSPDAANNSTSHLVPQVFKHVGLCQSPRGKYRKEQASLPLRGVVCHGAQARFQNSIYAFRHGHDAVGS